MSVEKEIIELLSKHEVLGTVNIANEVGISRQYARKLLISLSWTNKVSSTGPPKRPLWYIPKKKVNIDEKNIKDLVKSLDEYINFLEQKVQMVCGPLYVNGWKWPDEISNKSLKLRNKINELRIINKL